MDKPEPGPGEALIRVRACSLNYRDQLIAQGRYFGGLIDLAMRLNAAIDGCGITPVVDRVFAFENAAEAYQYQSSSALFGKVVISV